VRPKFGRKWWINRIGNFLFNAHLSNLHNFLTELEKGSDFPPLAARHGSNHELLKRIGRFQREIPSVNLDLSQNLSAVIGGATLVPDINSLHSLQPPWIRTFEANQNAGGDVNDLRGFADVKLRGEYCRDAA